MELAGGVVRPHTARTYARSANLDERLVIDVTWPMLQTVVDARGGDAVRLIPAEEPIDVLVPAGGSGGVPALHAVVAGAEQPPRRRAGLALAAAAAAALVISPAAFLDALASRDGGSREPYRADPRRTSCCPTRTRLPPLRT